MGLNNFPKPHFQKSCERLLLLVCYHFCSADEAFHHHCFTGRTESLSFLFPGQSQSNPGDEYK